MNSNKNIKKFSFIDDFSTKEEVIYSKTQLEILYAAEIIMGQKGIENTSHRDIVNLAGQKNTSAIGYHFGGIQGVVNALLDIRMALLNTERLELLKKILIQKDYTNIDLANVIIDPLYKKVFHDKEWNNYIFFLHNVITRETINFVHRDNKYIEGSQAIEKLFAESNNLQNDNMYKSRISYGAFFFISAMASRKRDIDEQKIQKGPTKLIPSEGEFINFLKSTYIFILANKESN